MRICAAFSCGAFVPAHQPRQSNILARSATRHRCALATAWTSKRPRPILGTPHGQSRTVRQRPDGQPAQITVPRSGSTSLDHPNIHRRTATGNRLAVRSSPGAQRATAAPSPPPGRPNTFAQSSERHTANQDIKASAPDNPRRLLVQSRLSTAQLFAARSVATFAACCSHSLSSREMKKSALIKMRQFLPSPIVQQASGCSAILDSIQYPVTLAIVSRNSSGVT